jgi:hypothetical protein
MTKDDIARMAREAGFADSKSVVHAAYQLEAFANLVAAAERSECAKLAEQTICDKHIPTGVNIYGTRAAKAIRARGNT